MFVYIDSTWILFNLFYQIFFAVPWFINSSTCKRVYILIRINDILRNKTNKFSLIHLIDLSFEVWRINFLNL